MADILNLSFGCGNTLQAGQLNQIVQAINQLANQNGAQRGITLNTNTRELSITNNSSTADLDSILPYGIKDGGNWDDFITFYRDSNNNHEVDINGSGGRQCDLGVTGNIRTGLSNEYSYVRTDVLQLKNDRSDSYIGKLYSSNGNLYYQYIDGTGQGTNYPALQITRAKSINQETGRPTGFELNVDIPQNQNNNNTIGLADTDSIGGIKLWAEGDDPLDTYEYPVKLNHNGSAYVTVDWSNQGTTLAGLMGNNAIGSESQPIYWSGDNGFQACSMDTSGITAINLPSNQTTSLNNGTVTIPAATNDSYGVVKLGYDNSSNSNRHPVASDNGSGLYVDLSNASVPSIGDNDGVGEVLAIIQGANNTKQIGWAQLSPNGVAGVSSIEFGYSSGNTLAFAQAATSNQTLKLVPGDNVQLSSDTDNYPNSIKISASLEFQDLSDVPVYDQDGYLKYESGSLVWTNVAPGSGLTAATAGGEDVVSGTTVTIPKASSDHYGVIKAVSRSGSASCETANSSSTTQNYKVQVDNDGIAFVNVPWTDSGARTYSSVSGGPTANQNLSFGGSFTVPQVSQNTNGQISIQNRTMTLPSGGSGGSGVTTIQVNGDLLIKNSVDDRYLSSTSLTGSTIFLKASGITKLAEALNYLDDISITKAYDSDGDYNFIVSSKLKTVSSNSYIYCNENITAGANNNTYLFKKPVIYIDSNWKLHLAVYGDSDYWGFPSSESDTDISNFKRRNDGRQLSQIASINSHIGQLLSQTIKLRLTALDNTHTYSVDDTSFSTLTTLFASNYANINTIKFI